jgi:uncharacterized membrane protein
MKLWKKALLFYLGGMLYCGLELLWRGRTHGSMFLLGGACFLILGRVGALRMNLIARAVLGGVLITVGELVVGLLVNRGFQVWDYRSMPMNFCGQICLLYTMFWMMLSPVGFVVYRHTARKLPG